MAITHTEGFFSHIDFNELRDQLTTEYVNFFKRCVGGMGDSCPVLVREIIKTLQDNMGISVVSFFVNYYRDGNDYAPYHTDKYGIETLTLSFGCTRDFYLKHNQTKEVIKYKLSHGDLFCFDEETNQKYKHSIPKRTKLKDERISILFFYKHV